MPGLRWRGGRRAWGVIIFSWGSFRSLFDNAGCYVHAYLAE